MGARPARLGAGTTQESVRRHNLALALSYLHFEGQLSRVELTDRLGLNRSTIGALVGELVALGAVVEAAPQEPARRAGAGRPSLDVRPNSAGLSVLAVDIGVHALRVARIGLGGVISAQETVTTPPPYRPSEIAGKVAELGTRLIPPDGRLLGVSVAVPGVVQELEGVVRFAPNLNWRDIRLGDLLREELALDIPITLGNDAHLGALAELTRGAARGRKNVVFLMADVGLGGGIVIDGKLVRGTGGFAGEWGHLQVNPRGRRCRCGSIGCWETEVCAPAIARALHMPRSEVAEFLEQLSRLNRKTRKLTAVAGYLGQGLG
ncbi:MAG: ROK family transcriptional regulator, partial [Angustibacter sp.]